MSLLGVGGGTGIERAFIAVKGLSVNSIISHLPLIPKLERFFKVFLQYLD